jgi:hypothetical protein
MLSDRDLAGWRIAGSGGFRAVAEGVIESHGGPGLFWYANQAYDDFVLTVEWRLASRDANSGVFVRCPPLVDSVRPAIERGYEVQIDDRGFNPSNLTCGSALHTSGAIYQLAPAMGRYSRSIGEWNQFEICAQGSAINVTLNGARVSRLQHGTRERRGHIALQCHHEGSTVQFRGLQVGPLDSGGA